MALPWAVPDVFAGITAADLQRVQTAVRGGAWKADPQSEDWAGLAVADVLDLDVSDRKGRDAGRVKQLLKKWIDNGVLVKVTKRCDKTRRDKPFIVPGEAVEL